VTKVSEVQLNWRQIAAYRLDGALQPHQLNTLRPCCSKDRRKHGGVTRIRCIATPSKKSGRRADRVRYPRRVCRQAKLEGCVNVVTLNMQGWNWTNLEPGHLAKTSELVLRAREFKWDVIAMIDLHHTGDVVGTVMDARSASVALGEFILVVADRAAFLHSPAVQVAWRQASLVRKDCEDSGRISSIELEINGIDYSFVAIYVPDQSHGRPYRA
jgi:hypothetical protein